MSDFFSGLLAIGVVYLIYKFTRGSKGDSDGSMICPNCGSRGKPKTITKGSMGIEIILWLCFIIPGLIYSLWRLSTQQAGCPSCGQPGMIKINSPRGKQMISAAISKDLEERNRDPHPNQHTRIRCPACAELVLKAANVCKHCGLDLTEEKVVAPAVLTRECPHCHKTVPKEAIACKYCYREM